MSRLFKCNVYPGGHAHRGHVHMTSAKFWQFLTPPPPRPHFTQPTSSVCRQNGQFLNPPAPLRATSDVHGPMNKMYLSVQLIPIKYLQGFCFQGAQVAFSFYFNWQEENGRPENGNLVTLLLELTVHELQWNVTSAHNSSRMLQHQTQGEPGVENTIT